MRPSIFAAAALLALTGASPAQETPGRKDAQAAFEPRSAPGAGQKLLERMAGDWDVAKTFYPRAGEPAHSSGSCRQTMVEGGRFLKSEFTFGTGESVSSGLGLIGFETGNGKFTSVWVDSRRTQMSLRQSSDPFDGKQIVLYSRALGDNPNGPFRTRTVSHLEDGDSKLIHRQYALSRDGKERLMMELILTRKHQGAQGR